MPVGACTVSTVCECECGKRILGVNSSRAHDDDDEWTLMHSFTRASSNNIHPLGSTRRPGDSIPVHCISGKQVLLTNWVRRDDAEEGKGIFKATGKEPAHACATPS